ncbi:MAG TPA: helix-turn-helix transcriptional regulator [Candidatus Limnocylindrales bacterium]
MDRTQLADFLRSRRSRVTPLEAGLPDGRRRRIPGLRREEVAQLAGISADYYTRLEQSRGPRPSRQVLNALGRALMLTADERAHLFELAGETPAAATRGPRQDVPEGIMNLLHGLDATPAFVLDAKYDMLAWNEMFSALYGDLPAGQRNLIRWMFRSEELRQHLRDEESSVFIRGSVADLRAAAARYPDDKGISGLVTEMLALSKEFARLWAEHEVEVRRDSVRQLRHPMVGLIELRCQMLHIPDRDQRLVIYTATPGSEDQLALCHLRATTMAHERTIVVGLGPP